MKNPGEKAQQENSSASKNGALRGRQQRQLLACFSVQGVGLLAGLALAHSSSLIPQLQTPDAEILIDRFKSAWIASVVTLTVPLGSLLSGWMVDSFGRLATVKLSSVPYAASCAVVASAGTFEQLLAGRVLLGASIGIGMNACILYTTEVAEKEIRGSIGCLHTAIASLGIVVSYTLGAFLNWRTAAWSFCAAPLPLLALQAVFARESPAWLRERGPEREHAAREASAFFYGDPDMVLSASKSSTTLTLRQKFAFLFRQPTGLKPLLLVNVLFILQQFVGIYITLFYAVTFFQESGSDWDPYLASILLGVVRLAAVAAASLGAGRVGRRPNMVASALGMGVCMLTGAVANHMETGWSPRVVPVTIVLYMAFAGMGMQVLPWSMMAEVFPHEVRSAAQAINMATAHIYQFALLQLYPFLNLWMGGSAGVQFLFAGSSFLAALLSWLFLVETRGRTLPEIEEYFAAHTVYPGHKRRRARSDRQQAQQAVSTVCSTCV